MFPIEGSTGLSPFRGQIDFVQELVYPTGQLIEQIQRRLRR